MHKKPNNRGLKNGKYTRPERTPRGENHWNRKLTAQSVAQLRRKYEAGGTMKGLAGEYDISHANVSRIINRQTWKHLE